MHKKKNVSAHLFPRIIFILKQKRREVLAFDVSLDPRKIPNNNNNKTKTFDDVVIIWAVNIVPIVATYKGWPNKIPESFFWGLPNALLFSPRVFYFIL